jgi:hypothetical protein
MSAPLPEYWYAFERFEAKDPVRVFRFLTEYQRGLWMSMAEGYRVALSADHVFVRAIAQWRFQDTGYFEGFKGDGSRVRG